MTLQIIEGTKRKLYKRKPRTFKPRNQAKKALKQKKKRKTQIDLWREWLVPDGAKRRYKGLRGIYWYWLSRDVRKTEWEKWGGLCLTCLNPIEDWRMADCGHIVASRWCGEYLRFNRKNLTIQHKGCNNPRFCPQAGVLNAVNIDKRHGDGYMDMLLSLVKKECKEPGQEEYRQLIRDLPSYQEALSNTHQSQG